MLEIIHILESSLKFGMALGGAAFFIGGLYSLRYTVLILSDHAKTTGEIVDTRYDKGVLIDPDRAIYVTIKFTTESGEVIRYEQTASHDLFKDTKPEKEETYMGKIVPVHYKKSNPQVATTSLYGNSLWGLAFVVAGIFITAAIILNWNEIDLKGAGY